MRSVMVGSAWRRSWAMRHASLVGMLGEQGDYVKTDKKVRLTEFEVLDDVMIGLVDLGLTEETWAGGCRGLEMTVRLCVDGLRLVETGAGW